MEIGGVWLGVGCVARCPLWVLWPWPTALRDLESRPVAARLALNIGGIAGFPAGLGPFGPERPERLGRGKYVQFGWIQ